MSSQLHPTAIIGDKVELGVDVRVGPYSVIDGNARIGDRTIIDHHASIVGNTKVGSDNHFFPYVCVGQVTQALPEFDSRNYPPRLQIGNHNTIREFTTLNTGSNKEKGTVVGDRNLLMAYVHVAHDCIIGNRVVISNAGTLGGHVEIHDHATLGGFVAVHQYCRIGSYSMTGAGSMVRQDIPPFVLVSGNSARALSVNKVALQRAKFDSNRIECIQNLFRIFFRERNHQARMEQIEKIQRDNLDGKLFYDFISADSLRKYVRT